MQTTYDIESVRRFARDVEGRRTICNEQDFCSELDQHIHCLADLCEAWYGEVRNWAKEVFTGRVNFDPQVEAFFQVELQNAANKARPHVQHGHEVAHDCHDLARLEETGPDCCGTGWLAPELGATAARGCARLPHAAYRRRDSGDAGKDSVFAGRVRRCKAERLIPLAIRPGSKFSPKSLRA